MNELITKQELQYLGLENENRLGVVFKFDVFRVTLTDDPESPIIEMSVNGEFIQFPGTYTMKDLKDLMFMHYGEKEYNKHFGHLKAEIVEVSFSKEQMMLAFDEGFQSANKDVSREYYQETSAHWFKRRFE